MRGTLISRTLEFLRTGNLDEVEFVVGKGVEILKVRSAQAKQQEAHTRAPRKPRARKAQVDGAATGEAVRTV